MKRSVDLKMIAGVAATLVLLGSAVAAAATPRTSEDYGFATYRERAGAVTLIADTYLASQRTQDAFIPVPVAVGLASPSDSISITPSSFELIDAAGNHYPAANFSAVRERYGKLRLDRAVLRAQPLVVGLLFDGYHRTPSNFYPAPGQGLRIDRVELAPFTWFTDVLYFPRPADLSGILTVQLKPGGTSQVVETRVALPRPAGTAHAGV